MVVDSARKQCCRKHAFCERTWKKYNESLKTRIAQLWTVFRLSFQLKPFFFPVFCENKKVWSRKIRSETELDGAAHSTGTLEENMKHSFQGDLCTSFLVCIQA